MIAALRGSVLRCDADEVVIDANGVGYLVFCHVRTVAQLHAQSEVTLQIHTSVSDDAIRLYGFLTLEELRLFRLLIGVERVGPKAALAILGRAEMSVMLQALSDGDAVLLATVPGVGRKTAERLVLELRDKLDDFAVIPGVAVAAESKERLVVAQAVSALIGLGFREAEVRAAVAAVDHDDDVNAIISAALRQLDRVSTPT